VSIVPSIDKRLRAVVIDDDSDSRLLLATFLRNAGFGVRDFERADEALHEIRKSGAEVIVTDLQLPESSGADLARALRCDPNTTHVAIVALTGHVDPDWEVVRHFDAYLRKPFDPTLLPPLLSTLAAAAETARIRLGGDPGSQ
jgi:CheY-like chemotaxis protein